MQERRLRVDVRGRVVAGVDAVHHDVVHGVAAQEGVVFAGPEPLCSFEYVLECLRLARSFGLAGALVTTGYVTERVLRQVLPYLDAVLVRTAADAGAYEACGTDYSAVERTIELLYADESCTVDVQELA